MIYVLDTNICVFFLRGVFPELRKRIRSESKSLAVTIVTVAELEFGIQHSSRPRKNRRIMEDFLSGLNILPLDRDAARIFGETKQALKKKGKPVGPYDLLIASIVLSRGYTLVTHNIREFQQIEELRVENWMA